MSGLRPNEREEYLTKLERFASLITRLHELGVDWRPGLTVEDIEHVPEGTPVAAPANAERVF